MFVLIALAAAVRFAAAQSSQPSEAAIQIQTAWNQLGDSDPIIRESARIALMSISRDDLPVLRGAVEKSGTPMPGQVNVLHEVVIQAFLAGESYPTQPTAGGLIGLSWDEEHPAYVISGVGLVVGDRLAGFPSGEFLLEGDILRTITANQLVPMPIRELSDLTDFVGPAQGRHAGDVIRLQVIRHGQYRTISLPLGPVPTVVGDFHKERAIPAAVAAFHKDRTDKAEAYWQQSFASLVEPGIS